MNVQIPHGPDDAPFLLMPGQERMAFDPADKLGGMYMLDHGFKGRLDLRRLRENISYLLKTIMP